MIISGGTGFLPYTRFLPYKQGQLGGYMKTNPMVYEMIERKALRSEKQDVNLVQAQPSWEAISKAKAYDRDWQSTHKQERQAQKQQHIKLHYQTHKEQYRQGVIRFNRAETLSLIDKALPRDLPSLLHALSRT